MVLNPKDGVWDTSQQAIFNRRAAAREGENTEVGTRFLCLLFLSRLLDNNSYPDFFGIMTFYQECCICAIFSTKSQDNMDDFSLTYKFF